MTLPKMYFSTCLRNVYYLPKPRTWSGPALESQSFNSTWTSPRPPIHHVQVRTHPLPFWIITSVKEVVSYPTTPSETIALPSAPICPSTPLCLFQILTSWSQFCINVLIHSHLFHTVNIPSSFIHMPHLMSS